MPPPVGNARTDTESGDKNRHHIDGLTKIVTGTGWRLRSVRFAIVSAHSAKGGALPLRWSGVLVRRRPGALPLVERVTGRARSESSALEALSRTVRRVTGARLPKGRPPEAGERSDGPVVVIRCGTTWHTSGHRVSTAQGARDVVRRVLRLPIAAGATAELRDGYARTVPVPAWALSARSRSEWAAEHGPDALDQWPDGAWWVVPVWSDGPTRVRVGHLAGQTGPRGRKGADPPVLRPFRPSLWTDPPPIRHDDESAAQNAPDDCIREE